MGQQFTTSDQDNDSWTDGNKKIFPKSFEILYISSLSIFLKETALKYTLEAGGLMIVVLKLDYGKQTVGISGRPLSLFQGPLCLAILFF